MSWATGCFKPRSHGDGVSLSKEALVKHHLLLVVRKLPTMPLLHCVAGTRILEEVVKVHSSVFTIHLQNLKSVWDWALAGYYIVGFAKLLLVYLHLTSPVCVACVRLYCTYRHTHIQTQTHTHRHTHRNTHTDTHTHTHRHTHNTDTHTEKLTDTQTHPHT